MKTYKLSRGYEIVVTDLGYTDPKKNKRNVNVKIYRGDKIIIDNIVTAIYNDQSWTHFGTNADNIDSARQKVIDYLGWDAKELSNMTFQVKEKLSQVIFSDDLE